MDGGNNENKGSEPRPGWRVSDLLAIKAAGKEMTQEQIVQIVTSIADDTVDQTQLGAFLMAVFVQGMTTQETVALTKAMTESGTVFRWPSDWVVGDKHSTGGVGDKVSIPLTPALAACGMKVPMISGRGLAHTGGTLDKMESIPGLSVSLSQAELERALATVGCVISGQTTNLAPADKRMYAARDVTATVVSIPLVISSILSKKAAESLSCLVLDVKFGEGSLMKTMKEAEDLAQALVDTMCAMGVTTTALITAMDDPIGRTIGNALEVKEGIECLAGGGPSDLWELVTGLGGELLASSGLAGSAEEGRGRIGAALTNGTALATFQRMIRMQGVEEQVAAELCQQRSGACLPRARYTTSVTAHITGIITGQNGLTLAEVSVSLGAGRCRAGEPIDYSVGIVLDKVVGEPVEQGEVWATLHHQEPRVPEQLLQKVRSAIAVTVGAAPFPTPTRIVKTISATDGL